MRELEYLIARAVLKAKRRTASTERKGVLSLDALDLDVRATQADSTSPRLPSVVAHAAPPEDFRSAVDGLKRELLTRAIEQHGGNLAAAARALKLDRANLARMAGRLGIEWTPS